VFTAAMQSGYGGLVVLAMVATAVTAFFYLRIVVVMYFSEPVSAQLPVPVGAAAAGAGAATGGGAAGGVESAAATRGIATDAPFVVVPGILTVIVIAVAVIVTLGLGLFPGPVLDWLTVPIPMLS
jgi:NADH-quinone oxidoreductase subunit N